MLACTIITHEPLDRNISVNFKKWKSQDIGVFSVNNCDSKKMLRASDDKTG